MTHKLLYIIRLEKQSTHRNRERMEANRKSRARKYLKLQFEEHAQKNYKFRWDDAIDFYLVELKKKYGLEKLKDKKGNRYETLKNCLRWRTKDSGIPSAEHQRDTATLCQS